MARARAGARRQHRRDRARRPAPRAAPHASVKEHRMPRLCSALFANALFANVFFAIAFLAVAWLAAASPAAAADSASLVGTWRVERIVDTDAAGKRHYPYGEKPKGYIVYDPSGHLHVQIRRTPAPPPFAAGDDAKGSDAETRAAFLGYAAYFGTYRVDAAKGVVVHRVEGSLMPSYTGTDQPRPFRIDGDVLTIEGDSEGVHFVRQLRRVR
jgi:hypothetical protein